MSVHEILAAALREHQGGRLAEAEQGYRQVLAVAPDQPDALHLLGVIALQLGRPAQAVELIQAAIARHAANPEFHNNLGQALEGLGRWEDATAAYRHALKITPTFAVAHNNLGNTLHRLQDYAGAENAYHAALRLTPHYAQASYNLGNLLQDQGRSAEAVAAFRRALEYQPAFVDAARNLANALLSTGEVDAAMTVLEQTLRELPRDAAAWCNYGNVLKQQGRLDEAVSAYRRAVDLDPRLTVAWSNLLYLLHFHPGYSNEQIATEHRAWTQTLDVRPLPPANPPPVSLPPRRIKIGYVSPDFFHQAEAFFVLPLFLAHDRTQFEVHAFASVAKPDGLTERFRRAVEHWHDVAALSDAELAGKIVSENIDILVDLTMHMANNRLAVFARKPSPIQVTWLAYPGSTGLPAIDYRFTDAFMEPTGVATEYSAETPVRLPDSWCCYDPLFPTPERSPLPALRSERVTFGSLNNPCKHNEAVIRLWADLLRAKPDSRLLLLSARGSARTRLQDLFARHDIAADRLDYVEPASRTQYLEYYARIDIALDPFPYNGITTTCDALWMGVPVLTLPGTIPASRAGLSLLATAGLPEWIATSPADFIQRAVRLSADREQLAQVRAGLRRQMQNSPLADAPRFARGVESAFLEMWRHRCAEAATPPAPDSAAAAGRERTESFAARLATATTHHQAGRLAEATGCYDALLAERPKHADLLYLSAVALWQAGQLDSALQRADASLAVESTRFQAHLMRGVILTGKSMPEAAIASLDRAAGLKPDDPEIYYHRGNARSALLAYAPALSDYEKALSLRPDYPDAWNNRALALQSLGRTQEAKVSLQRALGLAPQNAIYHNNLGEVLSRLGSLAEARVEYETAIRLAPKYVAALNNLGCHLASAGELAQAIACFESALTAAPTIAQTYSNLGLALKDAGQIARAITCFRRSIELQPNNPVSHSNLLLTLHYDPACRPEALLREHQRWGERHSAPGPARQHQNARDPHRKLRVGYLSPDFQAHPLARFITPILRLHHREQFEVFSYADVPRPDAITAELQDISDQWRNVAFNSDEEIAGQIGTDQIDILVDLAAHSARNRLRVFARKPAPLQITYLAYCSTTGLRQMDYRLSDPFLDPLGQPTSPYTEETVRLESYWCYSPYPIDPPPLIGRVASPRSFTFGCLNNPCKISAVTLDAWSRLLQQLPQSKLLVHTNELGRTHVQQHFRAAGVAVERIEFVGKQSLADYLATYQRIDVCLDTFPFGGGTTSCDALWMGVPVVTLQGETAVSRAGASLLGQLGLSELVTETVEDYVAVALSLARDPARLDAWRTGLRQQIRASPLMDGPRFIRNLEAVYRDLWQRWCRDKS
ncbi:MAG: hypothetical protein RIQ93_391 [Verrucomicrobiota bacterium]|jgi:predicted O-linked N-acetylglucosamine transferase (SPINDLY family)